MNSQPRKLLIIAFFMLLFGAVVPFLMVIDVLESTFLLSFLVYISSMGGLFLGFLGIAMYIGDARSKEDDWRDF